LAPDEQKRLLENIKKYPYLNADGRRDTMLDFERNPVVTAVQSDGEE
jgi:hypothetical protein